MKLKQLKSRQMQSIMVAAVLSVVIAAPVMSQPLGLTTIVTSETKEIEQPVIQSADEQSVDSSQSMLSAPEGMNLGSDGLSRSQSEDLTAGDVVETSVAVEPEAADSTEADAQTISDGVESQAAVEDESAEPEKIVVESIFEPVQKTLYISASELNMRQNHTEEAPVIEKIPMGKKVNVNGESEEWLRVEYNGKTGYIVAEYATSEMVFIPVEQLRYVDASGLNVRSQPNAEAEVLTKLSEDDKVTRIGVGDGWSLIKTSGGTEGYVASKYLTPDVPASVIAAQQAQEAASQKKNEPAPSSNPGAVIGNADLAAIVDIAWSGIGVPYVSGGSSLSGFDCSGYTSWVYRQVGINIPRSSYSYLNVGMEVSMSEIRPGDIIAMDANRRDGRTAVTHVGIYVGNGQMLHASWNRQQIATTNVSSLNSYGMKPISVRRIVN